MSHAAENNLRMNDDNRNLIPPDKRGSIVVCGGQSKRMGYAKAELPLGDRKFIEWVVSACLQRTAHCVIVGEITEATRRELEGKFAGRLTFTRDQNSDLGPLEGIRTGLVSLPRPILAAFVSSCDVPLLEPGVVEFLFQQLGDARGLIPIDGRRIFGLTAIYRPEIAAEISDQIQTGNRRVSSLSTFPKIRSLPLNMLKEADPELKSVINLNFPADYFELCKRVNMSPPSNFSLPGQEGG